MPPSSVLALAVAAHRAGTLDHAQRLYAAVLAAAPHDRTALYNLALIQLDAGQRRPALARLRTILKHHPDDAPAHYTAGLIHEAEGDTTKSLYHLRRAEKLDPASPDPALALIRILDLDDARAVAQAAMARLPADARLPTQLGVACAAAGQPTEAATLFDRALALDPALPLALFNRALLHDNAGQWEAAQALYARAPGFEPAVFNLGELLIRTGDVAAGISHLDASLAARPGDARAISARLMAAQYVPGVTTAELATLHRAWDAKGQTPRAHPGASRDPHRPLRVGLVSSDFRHHPVGYFVIGVVESANPGQLEFTAYSSNRTAPDAITTRFQQAVAHWHDTGHLTDAALAEKIARDRIDILIDLGGHTRHARLGVFDRKPAPIQLTWAGYVGTTGLTTMDGLIADRHQAPADDAPIAEHIIRLPDGYVTFDPPTPAPEVGPLPAGERNPLTFASFHNPPKINAQVAALWASVLHRHPGARIRFTYAGYEIPAVQARIRGWFQNADIDPERLVFHGAVPRQALLELYAREIDIALDPFPYSGGLTTLEALWMGVPVVTLPGHSFAGRHSLSHLTVTGLPDLVAQDADDYVAIIDRLAGNRAALATLRAGLRQRMARSPLCDTARFAMNFATALRDFTR